MILGKRPLMRIFGDVRAFECSICDYMLLVEKRIRKASRKPILSTGSIEAAE
jgi:hypothetical protein